MKDLYTSVIELLEKILWEELGSKKDYEKEYGETPVGRLVRQIVGVDRGAVNEAFIEDIRAILMRLRNIHLFGIIHGHDLVMIDFALG